MAKRRTGESTDAFRTRWAAEHQAGSILSFATGEVALGGTQAPFDAMSATYFASAAGALAAAVERTGETVLACDEHLMSQKPSPEWRLKIVRTVYRRRDLSLQQFKDYWLKNHAKLEDRVIAESPVQRIAATFALPGAPREPAFDGMVELYFKSVEDIRAMFAGPIPAMMRKDEENFVQMDAPAIRVVATEESR